ncbi:hypothetical protein WK01_01220 [Burkholderia cepacia]|nr:hypothetical protein WK01_01220 [Burkholderia cepacia]
MLFGMVGSLQTGATEINQFDYRRAMNDVVTIDRRDDVNSADCRAKLVQPLPSVGLCGRSKGAGLGE